MILWFIATLAAYFVKGLCGFANTLVFTSVLSFAESNAAITPVDVLLCCPANAILAWRYRRESDWHVWLPAVLLIIAGIIPGVFFLKNLDARLVKIIFGVFVVLVGADMLIPHPNQKRSKLVLTVLGLLSGVLCGLYGIGVLLAAYLSKTAENSYAFKGNLAMVFLLEGAFRIALYAFTGVLTGAVLLKWLSLLPFMGLGLFLGMKCAGRLDEAMAKRLVVIMLMISGAALVITNL